MKNLLNIKYIAYSYLILLLLGAVLPINSVSPSLNDNYTLHIRWDYLLHAMVYIPLPVLLSLSLKKRILDQAQVQRNKISFWVRIALFSLFITALFELLQMFIPYRAFNINDMVANGVGATLGFLLILIFGGKLVGILKDSTG